MITHKEQLDLFTIIARRLSKNLECYAFGGTAMMFFGYKEETKDIDLLFERESDRKQFIESVESLGFEETSPVKIYTLKKIRDKHAPIMFKSDITRFDLFLNQIFRSKISPTMRNDVFGIYDFKAKNQLKLKALRTEHIVYLKGITNRDRDFEDILTIVNKDTHFDWQYFIDEAIWQHNHGDSWALLDTERMIKELKKYIFIPEKYFKQLYKAQQ